MASISPPTPHQLSFSTPKFHSPTPFLKPYSSSAPSSPTQSFHNTICHSHNPDSPSSPSEPSLPRGWDSALQGLLQTALKRFDSLLNLRRRRSEDTRPDGGLLQGPPAVGDDDDDDDRTWDWDRWRKHFDDVEEQERLVSFLKSRLSHAVYAEDYQDAARLKVAIAALATNDTVGRAMSHLHRAIEKERYRDAAFIRDNAGAGLVGWWSGTSKDNHNPCGLIIRITAEHGRYVARRYSPRQLATAADGVPLFEIFLRVDKKGEYKQQAVYLKRKGVFSDSSNGSSKGLDSLSVLNPLDPVEEKDDLFIIGSEETEDGDIGIEDSDIAVGLPDFQNILRDMIPGVKVKVLKVTTPGKVDKELISKVIEHIIEEEEDEEDEEDEEEEDGESEKESDFEDFEVEDKINDDHQEKDGELYADDGFLENQGRNEVAVKIVVGGFVQKLSGGGSAKNILRVPAKLEKKGRSSFSFSVEKDVNEQDSLEKELNTMDRKSKPQGQSSIDHVMTDLAKFIGKEKIPAKVLKDLSELIKLSISQAQNYQPLSGSTSFNRIEIPTSSDPLNGLYIGAHGIYTSEIVHLRRRFGRWKEDGAGDKEPSKLEFYEYVEAWKVIGDPYVPAGKVAFRAKVGKRYQLPHKGLIPEELGVIARYKGQGRLAEPGFRNPRWVDGELVILDGKYIKGGPVVGFVYWDPEFHFLVFFNRLRLQE